MSLDGVKVAILMGSQNDWSVMKKAQDVLTDLGVKSDMRVISAHRKAARLVEHLGECEKAGVKVFIAGAGMAAHLPGVVASKTTRPVIGVPIDSGPMQGVDALHSIVQMPPGIPVACVAIGGAGAKNAGILAAQILGVADDAVATAVTDKRAADAESLVEIPE